MLMQKAIAALSSLSLAQGALHRASTLLDSSFDDVAEYLIEALHVPGLSVAVVYEGEIKAKGYGFSQLPSTPATPDTLWFTGSTTKAFVAAAIGKIVQGHTNITGLTWSTPLAEILGNDFVLQDAYANTHLSLEDAMSHRSGLPRHDSAYGWGNCSTTDVLRTMRDLPFAAQPRTKFLYNNMMYAALGETLQRLTGKKLETVLRKWLWEPLGMRSTTFRIEEADTRRNRQGRSRLARGYFWAGSHYVPERWYNVLPLAGAGATISSVNDYALWARALLAAGSGSSNRSSPLDYSLYQALTTPRNIVADLDLGATSLTYALGWVIGSVGGKTIVMHSGGLPGFGTMLYLVPEMGLAFVSVGNTAQTSAVAGAALFVETLHRAGALDAADKQQHIDQAERLSLPFRHTRHSPAAPRARPSTLPLPGSIHDYTGIYNHPAYGTFHVSLAPESTPLAPPHQTPLLTTPALQITPSARTWSSVYALTHSTHTTFDMDVQEVHGPAPRGDAPCAGGKAAGRQLRCKNAEARETMGGGRAVFARGVGGEVEGVGIEVEPEMGREEGAGWREGMVWFARAG